MFRIQLVIDMILVGDKTNKKQKYDFLKKKLNEYSSGHRMAIECVRARV